MSNKQATAYGIAHLILNLPTEIAGLHILYDDCDCGYGPHEVNSLYPDKDNKCNIYLRPTREFVPIDEIVAEYNRLKKDNTDVWKRVEKARGDGIEIIHHTDTPWGWDKCELKKRGGQVGALFNPKEKEEHAATIIEYFTNALKDAVRCQPDGKNYKYWQFFRVGYPGNRSELPFNLNDLRVDMIVTDMEVTPEEFPHDSYMHLKLHFKVTMDWEPDLDHFLWKDMDVRYKHRDIYEFDDTLTLIRLPLGADGEAAVEGPKLDNVDPETHEV